MNEPQKERTAFSGGQILELLSVEIAHNGFIVRFLSLSDADLIYLKQLPVAGRSNPGGMRHRPPSPDTNVVHLMIRPDLH